MVVLELPWSSRWPTSSRMGWRPNPDVTHMCSSIQPLVECGIAVNSTSRTECHGRHLKTVMNNRGWSPIIDGTGGCLELKAATMLCCSRTVASWMRLTAQEAQVPYQGPGPVVATEGAAKRVAVLRGADRECQTGALANVVLWCLAHLTASGLEAQEPWQLCSWRDLMILQHPVSVPREYSTNFMFQCRQCEQPAQVRKAKASSVGLQSLGMHGGFLSSRKQC